MLIYLEKASFYKYYKIFINDYKWLQSFELKVLKRYSCPAEGLKRDLIDYEIFICAFNRSINTIVKDCFDKLYTII